MDQNNEHHHSLPLRLCPSILQQAARIAQKEGTSLNYFISVALSEKMDRLQLHSQKDEARASFEQPPAAVKSSRRNIARS